MKVVLRNPMAPDGRVFRHLAIGREYEVLGIECDAYRIIDEKGEPVLFETLCFEVTDPSEPAFWQSVISDENERFAYPPGWNVPGFFEAWHEENQLIRDIFSAQLTAWYPSVNCQKSGRG